MNVLNQVRRQRGLGEGEGVAGGDNETLFSVHRLDTPTSGLLVFAKDADAAGKLQRGFQNRARDRISKEGGDNEEEKAISKFYVAVVSRKLKKKMGVLRGNLVKGRRGSWKLEEKGEDNFAQTNFVDLGSAGGSVGGRRVILMRPITGRTHQLRVTMKSLGGAIVGDERYGSGGGEEGRLLLHACGIRLDLKSMEVRPRGG
ncbi:hypothetical protein TL16_g05928 [Triparma laevis f. inornata]|uniref:Pseudouridine synthase RsuA/RluA-like domain-containing protein n=2 Tax=Triparma laevis TaxID=1534972 RepID=A0A9W7FPS0_9STRA|nr:hypothetical protein TL16_g05928 [Triparma laevis f. inornata]GMI15945.1 hypothetical protein TrLO_g3333 [Triparma laevis f. longispina]